MKSFIQHFRSMKKKKQKKKRKTETSDFKCISTFLTIFYSCSEVASKTISIYMQPNNREEQQSHKRSGHQL